MFFSPKYLSLGSPTVRIPFLSDPFGNYFMPTGLIQVWFSASWPLHVASCILIVLMWHELVSSSSINVRTQGFLTSSRVPAAIVIFIVCVIEWITACLRAVGLTGFIIYANAYVTNPVPPRNICLTSAAVSQCCVLLSFWSMFYRIFIRIYRGLSLRKGIHQAHNQE
jgi:hypothetical protein